MISCKTGLDGAPVLHDLLNHDQLNHLLNHRMNHRMNC